MKSLLFTAILSLRKRSKQILIKFAILLQVRLTHAQTFFRGVGIPTGKIHFSRLRVRSASLADLRMRTCYQNNGGSNISKRENSQVYRDYFRNCAPVSLGEQRILIK
jgi:hypothetical protein